MAVKIAPKQTAKKPNATTSEKGILELILAFMQKDIQLGGSGLNDKFKESFFMDLFVLLSAGVDIKSTMELMIKEQKKDKERQLITDIKENIIQGATMSEALKKTEKFSPYDYFSVQIGEETGKINEVLQNLSGFYTNKIKQSRQVVSALSYPVVVLTASIGAIAFMMQFVVPMFSDIFRTMKGDLPWITKMILRLSDVVKTYSPLFFLFLIGGIVALYMQREKIWFRKYGSKLVLRIPLIGEIMQKVYLARFCSSMALLTAAKVPLVRAIKLVRQMIGFYPIETSLDQIEKDIINGVSLNESMGKYKIYLDRMISLVKVGEEVNRLELFFDKINIQYTAEVDHKTSLIGTFLEPIMIIFLGLVVGTILIAMYLPLFSLGSMMK